MHHKNGFGIVCSHEFGLQRLKLDKATSNSLASISNNDSTAAVLIASKMGNDN